MGFEVDPDDLEAFSRQLARASGDVRSALDYMQKECTIGPFDRGPLSEIASMFKSGHEEVFSSTKSSLEKLGKILDSSKREMSQSAKYYANTDRSEASRWMRRIRPSVGELPDALFPDGELGPVRAVSMMWRNQQSASFLPPSTPKRMSPPWPTVS